MYPGIQDTIVAISTSAGKSLDAIIRMSGTEAIPCIKNLFVPATNIDLEVVRTYNSVKGHMHSPQECVNIPVLLYIMKKPCSYTKEDVVEIHTVGSTPLVEMVLDIILSQEIQTGKGIRLSQPGEFTKRAFLHGRIDLMQAEATMRIIRAQTDLELKAAVEQLTGNVLRQIKRIQNEVVSLCALIEAAIDFSDQDIELISTAEIMRRLEAIKTNISHLISQSETGRVSPEGIDTVLYGRPNVGKSSLINALLGKKRSLVSEIPGTTRDIVTDILETGGIRFKLTDMAGVNDTQGTVMARAMEKVQSAVKRAQVIVLVFDGSADLSEQFMQTHRDGLTDNMIIVINKSDLQKERSLCDLPAELKKYPLVHTSALTGEGLERLKRMMAEIVLGGKIHTSTILPVLNMRQKDAFHRFIQSIQQAMELARNNESYEFIALDLRTAVDTLGEVVGEVTTEDILDKIFSEFCIGK